MTDRKETKQPAPEKDTAALEELAERYLDFWQKNLTVWATDPKAMEKWVTTLSATGTPYPSDDD